MQTYITQLIEDLTAAQNKEHISTPENFEDYIDEVERYLSGDGEQSIRDIIGIQEECFPPADRLTQQQLKTVSDAYMECIESWNICIDLPDNLPVSLKYTLLTGTLKQKVVVMDSGVTHLELCNYESESCPFGIDFCRCLNTHEDSEFMDSM